MLSTRTVASNGKLVFWSFALLFLCQSGLAQLPSDDTAGKVALQSVNPNSVSYEDVITYNPPSQKFTPILLQTHNDKLRFGQQNNYFLLPDESYIKQGTALAGAMDKKSAHVQYGREAFYELLRFKYMSAIYNDMDRSFFTKRTNPMYLKDKNSYQAQQNFLRLANAATSIREMYRYFCNPKKEDCAFDGDANAYYHRGVRNVRFWGGKEANEFRQLNTYRTYVSENFEELQQWSSGLFPNDTAEGYFVVSVSLGNYDFKNQGYWLNTRSFSDSGFLTRFMKLDAATANERKLVHPHGTEMLFKLDPGAAEELTESRRTIFLVFQIQLTIKGMEKNNNERVDARYKLQSPIIELFTDDDLSEKIGELSIENMTTK